jgi:plastocyanin
LVRGQLTRRVRAIVVCALAGAAALAAATDAGAANRRISISDFQWSDTEIELDRGEHVTWYWVGPDTVHSVTGDSPDAEGIDSDPGNPFPNHPVGDSFQVAFSGPGSYSFKCKLHSSVRGTVTVSSTPGDPTAEPDPVPENKVDRTGPHLREIALDSKTVHHRGARLQFALNESAKVYADYFRIDRRGRRKYAGYQLWRDRFVGYNDVRFGAPDKHFDAERGRYEAKLWAADSLDNTSRRRKVRFQIRPR